MTQSAKQHGVENVTLKPPKQKIYIVAVTVRQKRFYFRVKGEALTRISYFSRRYLYIGLEFLCMLLCGFIGGIVLLSFKQAPRRERWQGVSCLPGKTENLKKQIAYDLKLTT